MCAYTYMHHIFIHSFVDGHLSCFHILAIVNNAALDIEVHFELVFSFFFFSDISPRVKLLYYMAVLFLVSWEISILFSIVAAPIYIPTKSV